MQSRLVHALAVVAAGLAAQPAFAEEEAEKTGLSGNATFGFTQSRGNTDNLGLSGGAEAEYRSDSPWVYDAKALFVKREEDGSSIEERYEARGSANYFWTEDDYFYARLQWRKDLFGGVREEWLPSVGYGRILVNTEAHTLKGEVGAGYKFSELQDGTNLDGVALTGGLKYAWQISESAEFIQNLFVEWTSDKTYLESETGLRTTIVGNLGAKFSYVVQHNTEVAPGSANTDFFTTVGLDYAF